MLNEKEFMSIEEVFRVIKEILSSSTRMSDEDMFRRIEEAFMLKWKEKRGNFNDSTDKLNKEMLMEVKDIRMAHMVMFRYEHDEERYHFMLLESRTFLQWIEWAERRNNYNKSCNTRTSNYKKHHKKKKRDCPICLGSGSIFLVMPIGCN